MRVDLDELERLEKAAIDSPWKHSDRDGSIIHYPKDRGPDGINHSHVVDNAFGATGALIAATRNALPALIAELRAARECVRLYKRAGGLGWFFAAYPCTSCNTGVRHDRLDCELVQEAYQRGRDEERAKALSGADAYLKHAITEATNEAYQRGKADERAAVVAYLRSPRIGCTFEADEVEKGEHEVKR